MGRCAVYMVDAQSIFLVSVSGQISWLSLGGDMQLKVHTTSQLAIFRLCSTNTRMCHFLLQLRGVLGDHLLHATIVLGAVLCV